jgi:predicted nucleic acid-binding protein
MVLSELRKTRRDARLVAWLQRVPAADLHLSVVTLGEVEKGIAKQQRQDPAFAERLARWLDLVLRQYGSRILAMMSRSRGGGVAWPMRTAILGPIF